jgi:hypothetical protein
MVLAGMEKASGHGKIAVLFGSRGGYARGCGEIV